MAPHISAPLVLAKQNNSFQNTSSFFLFPINMNTTAWRYRLVASQIRNLTCFFEPARRLNILKTNAAFLDASYMEDFYLFRVF